MRCRELLFDIFGLTDVHTTYIHIEREYVTRNKKIKKKRNRECENLFSDVASAL